MIRLRVNFNKTEAMRFTSHLDLYRAWERTLRRAKLPLSYSQGFKPHPKINIAAALPLGFTSRGDLVDIWLAERLDLATTEAVLKKSVPPGLEIVSIEEISPQIPSLQSKLIAAEYSIILLTPIPGLKLKIKSILASPRIIRQRNHKEYDMRPLILDIKFQSTDENHRQRLYLILKTKESETGRPEEVILTLGGNPNQALIQREKLIFSDP
jgi:radical SAM-linked protein